MPKRSSPSRDRAAGSGSRRSESSAEVRRYYVPVTDSAVNNQSVLPSFSYAQVTTAASVVGRVLITSSATTVRTAVATVVCPTSPVTSVVSSPPPPPLPQPQGSSVMPAAVASTSVFGCVAGGFFTCSRYG